MFFVIFWAERPVASDGFYNYQGLELLIGPFQEKAFAEEFLHKQEFQLLSENDTPYEILSVCGLVDTYHNHKGSKASIVKPTPPTAI